MRHTVYEDWLANYADGQDDSIAENGYLEIEQRIDERDNFDTEEEL